MKKYILLQVHKGTISGLENLKDWAKDKPDETYVIEEPKRLERDRTLLQNSAYWGRVDFFVKHVGEYSKRGYHAIFMQIAGFGEWINVNGNIQFVQDSLTNVKISQIDQLLQAQDHYNADRNEDLPPETQLYLPSPEEFRKLRGY